MVQGGKSSKETGEADMGNGGGREKQSSKRKDKGKKGRKGKGRGKKSNKDVSEKDRAVLKEFLDTFRGTRRLMVRVGCKQRAKYTVILNSFTFL